MKKIILLLIVTLLASKGAHSEELDDYIGYWKSNKFMKSSFLVAIPRPKITVITKADGIYYYNENAINDNKNDTALNADNEKFSLAGFNIQLHLSDDRKTLVILDSKFERITKDEFSQIKSKYLAEVEGFKLQKEKEKMVREEKMRIERLKKNNKRLAESEELKRNDEQCNALKVSMKSELGKNRKDNEYLSISRDNPLRQVTKDAYRTNKKKIKNKFSVLKEKLPKCR
jgi:hypothetical protein